jgi:selenocysteine lyase/cysteine desulfurase
MDTKITEQYRREFPVTKEYIYMDHAGIAPLSLRVKTAIETFLEEAAEGAAFHYPRWAQRAYEVRKVCARLVNSGADEIAFIRKHVPRSFPCCGRHGLAERRQRAVL